METKTRAVVLRMVKYGESKLVVDMFTEEHGRVAFMVSASNSHKGRNKRRLFQPLSLLYIRYDHRLKPGLQTLCEASLAYPLSDLPTHPHKLPIAFSSPSSSAMPPGMNSKTCRSSISLPRVSPGWTERGKASPTSTWCS